MEQKNLKTSVFSTNTVFCESAEQPIDIDFTLPDYYADISKILKCRAISRISSKNLSGNHISVEGCITVTVIYCGSDNYVSSYEYQYPFSKSFDTGINTQGCFLNVKTKCEYINCRAITGRKIDIHGAAGIYVTLTNRSLVDVISDCDDCNVELLRKNVPATIPIETAEKYLLIEEEIELGSGQPDIRCLIRYDADATITDNKIMAGKSVVKGELLVKMLYAPENDGALQTVRWNLPFSQFIELDGITEECDCESSVCVAHLEIKPRALASGECRRLMLTAKLLITSKCCCNNDVAVILDAYSRKYEANICKSEVAFDKIVENINNSFSCKKSFEFFEGEIASISDMWCEARTDSVKFVDDMFKICGTVTAFIIAQNDDMEPNFYEKAIEFEYAYPMKTDGDFKCLPEITVTTANYTLMGERSVEIRVDLNVCATVYKSSSIPIITDINVNNTKPIMDQKNGAMTLYFATVGEKTWDIARKYIANLEELKQINEITDDILKEDKMLLIPNN